MDSRVLVYMKYNQSDLLQGYAGVTYLTPGDSKIKDVKLHVSDKPGFGMKLLGKLDPALELRSPNIDIQSDQRRAKHRPHLLNR